MRAAMCSSIACAASANARGTRARAVHRGRKTHRDARGEVARLIDTFRIAAGEATRSRARSSSCRFRGTRAVSRRVKRDLSGFVRLSPRSTFRSTWSRTGRAGIAAGCSVRLKPAARTPIGAVIIARCLRRPICPRAHFDPALLQPGGGLLVEDERIALLSFTGGCVGWEVKARAGARR